MKKIAIIGVSRFQEAALLKAKEMGLETHAFAWESGAPGEKMADYFYPISIREEDEILEKCRQIGIEGIISIGSDLAMNVVNYVAENMGLTGNSVEATRISTNKYAMREAFAEGGVPSPISLMAGTDTDLSGLKDAEFPMIVKPTDRSGSRGVNKVERFEDLKEAVETACEISFENKAVVEQFVEGDEYSIEYISCEGKHWLVAVTRKVTSGAPHFVETAHMQPWDLEPEVLEDLKSVCEHALDVLMLKNGAAHIEVKIDSNNTIRVIEIGGRMGGDFIGSDLVPLTTGYDYVGEVIRIAMGEKIDEPKIENKRRVRIRFLTDMEGIEEYYEIKKTRPESVFREVIDQSLLEDPSKLSIFERDSFFIYERQEASLCLFHL